MNNSDKLLLFMGLKFLGNPDIEWGSQYRELSVMKGRLQCAMVAHNKGAFLDWGFLYEAELG